MYSYPICGDPSRRKTYYYCDTSRHCRDTGQGNNGRYRKTVDHSGDVCEDILFDCQCPG